MKLLLVDDHALVRNGVASLLTAHNITVVGEAGDGYEAVQKTRELKPDIVLMDVQMPRCNGLEATRLIKTEMPDVKVIMLTVSDDEEDLFEAIKLGAEGYILKNIKSEEFLSLLDGVAQGEAPISPVLAAKIIEEFSKQATKGSRSLPRRDDLTEREISVLKLVTTGALNKEIAVSLNISENTVKYHLRNIMEKLHLTNKTQMAAYGVRKGLIPKSTEPK